MAKGNEKEETKKEIRKANFEKRPRLYVKGIFTGLEEIKYGL